MIVQQLRYEIIIKRCEVEIYQGLLNLAQKKQEVFSSLKINTLSSFFFCLVEDTTKFRKWKRKEKQK